MNTVFLYAGQGSQTVGMGKDFYEEYPVYRNIVDSLSGVDNLVKLMHEGPIEELSKTENTQGCMSIMAAGITAVLKENGITPDGVCGLSLGEYGALHAAGVFDAKEYVALTTYRGQVMAKAAKGLTCSMSAVLGAERELVEETVKEYSGDGYVVLANYNCPGQYVICGDEEAVSQVETMLKDKGVKRCVRLNVSGPFHTKYMAPAGEDLRTYFEKMEFNKPQIPVALNVTGDFCKEEDDLKELLIKQVQSSVHMEDDLRTFINAGARNFVEIGPGNVVSGFLKKTAKSMGVDVNVTTISTVEDLKKMLAESN